MGPGSDCPPHLVRYPTAASRAKLVRRFGLADDPFSQDWEVEVADFLRTEEFLSTYGDPDLTDDGRFLLMELIVASLDDGASSGRELGVTWPRTRRILLRHARLHAPTLSYWACGNDADPDHQFAITPLIRWVWYDVLADPALLARP
jgi:hypothetical protein